jgi:peptidase inhibitor family I36
MSKCASSTALGRVVARSLSRPHGWRGEVWRMLVATLLALAAIVVGTGGAQATPPENPCPTGTFCTWPEENYTGQMHELGIQATALEECVPLQAGFEVRSFMNKTGHPVTVYQDVNCATEAEFATYPTGSQTPQATYVARAIKIWSH